MKKVNGVHTIYKELGETPFQAMRRFVLHSPEFTDIPMTYAGRLDPMAEGLLLILSGDMVKEKDEYNSLEKTYEFQVLWRFETDTLDVLGKVSVERDGLPLEKEIGDLLRKSLGKTEQEYPAYSSKPVNGKPLFQWAREGKLSKIKIPFHEVEIFNARFLSRKRISKEDLYKEIISKIEKVSGDFRQAEILDRWKTVLEKTSKKEFVIDEMRVTASGGFYVRQFVHDLARVLNASATTFHIKRTKVGTFCL